MYCKQLGEEKCNKLLDDITVAKNEAEVRHLGSQYGLPSTCDKTLVYWWQDNMCSTVRQILW